ncbi:hypothetical protein CEXT_516531 [Caerostris extrusa]|uniref:Uncharacterized protein n=1 Tax=Caerostris extrusa TaxID=172846 RepID=A0AAV4Q044_CAEEX|nr:hypothetical protein CEXT_516531 [Caerostris extrusa]
MAKIIRFYLQCYCVRNPSVKGYCGVARYFHWRQNLDMTFTLAHCGFFMSLYALLYAVRVQNIPIPIMRFVELSVNATLMIIIVLSADHAQRKADQFAYHFMNIVESIPQWRKYDRFVEIRSI